VLGAAGYSVAGLGARWGSIRGFPELQASCFFVLVLFMYLSVTLTVAERIAVILEGLGRAVVARITPRGPGGAMAASLILLVRTRIRRVEG
jgi:hypothetical protein